jgi:glycine betaine transporter
LWGTLMGAVAIVLLLSGGLASLQQAAIIVGAPFTLVMLGLVASLHRSLRTDHPPLAQREPSVASPESRIAETRPGTAAGS